MTTHRALPLPLALPLRTPEAGSIAHTQPNRGDLIHSALSSPLTSRPPLHTARSYPNASGSHTHGPSHLDLPLATRPPLRSAHTSSALPTSSSPSMDLDADLSGGSASGSSGGQHDASVKKRRRTTPEELKILEDAYLVNNLPSSEERAALAERTGMGVRGVQIWFQNKRQTEKRKMHQQTMYPGVMLIPIHGPGTPLPMGMGMPYPHPHGHHAPGYPMPSPGYAYMPQVVHATPSHGAHPLPAPTPVRTHTTPASSRPALATIDANASAAPARSRSTDALGQADHKSVGKAPAHGDYPYAYAYAYAPGPGAQYAPAGARGYAAPLHALPGMGHVRAAQAYAHQVQTHGKTLAHQSGSDAARPPRSASAVFASSSERTRRVTEGEAAKEGYSSDSAADASSPIKVGVPAQPVFRARVGSEGGATLRAPAPRAARSDSCASLPAPKPSLRAEHGLGLAAPRPPIVRTQSARPSLSVRELAGLVTSRPRSSLGFDAGQSASRPPFASRGILDEMCTRRELPFPAPPSSPIKPLDGVPADDSPMVTPAREAATSAHALRLAHLVSDPPSMEKPTTHASASDDSSSPGVASDRDEESDGDRVAIARRRVSSFGTAKSQSQALVDEDMDDRPTLRRLASLDYYAGTPARRSMSVGLGAMRMGAGPVPAPLFTQDARKLAVPVPIEPTSLKRRASEHDVVSPQPRKARRSVPDLLSGDTEREARRLPALEPSSRTERDEECARLLLGLGMFGV